MTRTRFSALAATLLLAGCGGGGGKAGSTTSAPPPPPAASAPTQTATTSTTPAKPPPSHGQTVTTPENGGSEPARNPVTISVDRFGVSIPEVRVAPFIAVAITLHSKDGSAHTARVAGRTLHVGAGRRNASVTLPGLPTSKTYSVVVDGSKQVRIVSSGEPGP